MISKGNPGVARLGIYRLAAWLLGALVTACAATQTSQSTGGYIDDVVITTKVKAKIAADPNLSAREIKVETYDGVVQLSGFVDSAEAVQRASNLAQQVAGVRRVENDLIVKTQMSRAEQRRTRNYAAGSNPQPGLPDMAPPSSARKTHKSCTAIELARLYNELRIDGEVG